MAYGADVVAREQLGQQTAHRDPVLEHVRDPGAGEDELPGDDPLPDDLLRVVDVLDEAVERAHALGETPLDVCPLVGRQDARDEVEREGAIAALAAVRAGGVERDALLDEDGVASLAGG